MKLYQDVLIIKDLIIPLYAFSVLINYMLQMDNVKKELQLLIIVLPMIF